MNDRRDLYGFFFVNTGSFHYSILSPPPLKLYPTLRAYWYSNSNLQLLYVAFTVSFKYTGTAQEVESGRRRRLMLTLIGCAHHGFANKTPYTICEHTTHQVCCVFFYRTFLLGSVASF